MHNISHESSSWMKDYSKSVMLIGFKSLMKINSSAQWDTSSFPTLNAALNICPAELVFKDELAFLPGAIGTGFLLSPSILVTAGHNLTGPFPGIINCHNFPTCDLTDLDGDRRKDIVRASNGNGVFATKKIEIALSNGQNFGSTSTWSNALCGGDVYVNWGNNSGRPNPIGFSTYLTLGGNCSFGDVNGDGISDIFEPLKNPINGKGNLYVATSTGSPQLGFRTRRLWQEDFCGAGQCALGDINGDGRMDAMVFFYNELAKNYQLWSSWAR